MPQVITRKRIPTPSVLAPRRVALAVQPEIERDTIPSRVTLAGGAVPFAGELREEQAGGLLRVPDGAEAVLATLRRPWTFVGAAIDPRSAGAGLTIRLQIITRSMVANLAASSTAVAGVGPFAIGAFQLGARAQLVVKNATGALVQVRGVIWGMSEK